MAKAALRRGRQISRFRQRHRRDRARPLAPHLVEALREQAEEALALLEPVRASRGRSGWRERLVDNSFADTVFFGNSGAEACELALKVARKYQHEVRPSRALPHHRLRRLVSRPHLRHPRRCRQREVSRRLRAADGRFRPCRLWQSERDARRDRRRNCSDHRRAGSGRGRRAAGLGRILRGLRAIADEFGLS